MTSLKLSASESKKETMLTYDEGDGPAYPYGTTIYLDNDTLKKLGITELPEVGSKFTLTGTVVVTGVSMRQEQDGDACKCVDLQITDMDLGAGEGPSTADALYGG